MALTITKFIDPPGPFPFVSMFMQIRKIAFTGTYVTGGEALSTAELGFSKAPDWVEIEPKSGYVFEYIAATQKVIVRQDAGTSGAAAALIEVANGTSLTAVTGVIVKAYGRWAG